MSWDVVLVQALGLARELQEHAELLERDLHVLVLDRARTGGDAFLQQVVVGDARSSRTARRWWPASIGSARRNTTVSVLFWGTGLLSPKVEMTLIGSAWASISRSAMMRFVP
jgi:hypothetical protein